VRTLTTIVRGAHNMLQLAQQLGAKILHASGREVYGDPAAYHSGKLTGVMSTQWAHACYGEASAGREPCFPITDGASPLAIR
jgi:hypothetical protein